MKQLSGRDATFLFLDDGSASSTILSCSVLRCGDDNNSAITAETVVEWLSERLDITDLFRSKIIRLPGDLGLPYWVHDPTFSVVDHVVIHETAGVDWARARRLLVTIADRRLDPAKPLWMLHVLPHVAGVPEQAGLSTIVAVQFHHVLFDGQTFVALAAQMFREQPSYTPSLPVGPGTSTVARLTSREIIRMPGAWIRCLRGTTRAWRSARARHTPNAPRPTPQWPITRFNKRYEGPRVSDFVAFERDAVLALKARVPGATVNDVMLAVVGEALLRYLSEIGEPPGATMSALAPISTRTTKVSADSNQFSFMTVDLMLTEPDLQARIRSITTQTTAGKARIAIEYSAHSESVVEFVPAPLLRLLARFNVRSTANNPERVPFNVVVSKVHSSLVAPTIFGLPVVGGFGMQPLKTGTTLGHAVSNRAELITISFTVDQSAMPDTSRYSALLLESFDAHLAAVSGAVARGDLRDGPGRSAGSPAAES